MRFVFFESGREAGTQPLAGSVQHEDPRRPGGDMDFAGVEEEQSVVALLQHDDRVGMRLDSVFGCEFGQDEPAESPLTES
jgi:hypothetical protein